MDMLRKKCQARNHGVSSGIDTTFVPSFQWNQEFQTSGIPPKDNFGVLGQPAIEQYMVPNTFLLCYRQ